MKTLFLSLVISVLALSTAFIQPTPDPGPDASPGANSFSRGEVLSYKLHYGFINAGEAEISVDPKLYKVNDKICYHMRVEGKSTGSFGFMMKIRDYWGSYIDTSVMIPHKAYRNIEEGKYTLKEVAVFNHSEGKVVTERNEKEIREYDIPRQVHDIVSGYYYLRTIDFDKKNPGDIIKLNAFLDDQVYDFSLRYVGKEDIKTKMGKVRAIVISPIMPENGLFDGENSIRVWISDDLNKIPLRAEAKMFLGAVALDLKDYKGLKHPIGAK